MTDRTDQTPLDPKDPRVQNRATFLRVGLLFAVAMLIASTMRPVFFAGTLSTLLFFGSLGAAGAALFLHERPMNQRHLTRWDEAAMLLLVSLLVGSFANPQAMQEAMQQQHQQQQQTAAVSPGQTYKTPNQTKSSQSSKTPGHSQSRPEPAVGSETPQANASQPANG